MDKPESLDPQDSPGPDLEMRGGPRKSAHWNFARRSLSESQAPSKEEELAAEKAMTCRNSRK